MNTKKSKLIIASESAERTVDTSLALSETGSIGRLDQPLLSGDALIRLPQVLALVPVSRSAWWQGVRSGRYPKGIKISSRTTAWRVRDIAILLASFHHGNGGAQ